MFRDTNAESKWAAHPIIGYIALNKDGTPYQATVSNAYNHMFDKKNRKPTRQRPITVYKTLGKAAQYSPVDTATEVRMFQPMETA